MAAAKGTGRRRRSAITRFPRRLLAGVLIGVGTIFGAKAERDQHWAVPPTMVDEGAEQGTSADGEGDDPPRLPACA